MEKQNPNPQDEAVAGNTESQAHDSDRLYGTAADPQAMPDTIYGTEAEPQAMADTIYGTEADPQAMPDTIYGTEAPFKEKD